MPMQISAGNQYLPRTGEKVLEAGNHRANVADEMAARLMQKYADESGQDERMAAQLAVKTQMQKDALAAKAAIAAARGSRGNGGVSETPIPTEGSFVMTPQQYAAEYLKSTKSTLPGQPAIMAVTPTSVVRDKKGKVIQYVVKPNPAFKGNGFQGAVVQDPSSADSVAAAYGLDTGGEE